MQFEHQVALGGYNTFGVTATAAQLAHVTSEQALIDWARTQGAQVRPLLLGGGSNLLLTRDVDEPVLRLEMRGLRVLQEDTQQVIVEAMAGEPWHEFVQWTVDSGWSGLENLSLIPGLVGAAPVQNIGAYGVEIADSCIAVTAVDLRSGELRVFSAVDCAFGYRDSIFKRMERDRYAITRVSFRLSKAFTPQLDYGDIRKTLADKNITQPTARDVADAVIHIRRSKLPDPALLGNAGSFFKNPIISKTQAATLLAQYPLMPQYPAGDQVKLAAGWLIDQTGWKGRRLGAAGVHAQHALVLVNHGGATGAEVWAVAQAVQRDVEKQFGITLEAEPRIR